MSHSQDLRGEQEVGATQAPFLQRQHRHKQGGLEPQDSRVSLEAPLYSWGEKQANAGFNKENIAGGPATSLGLFALQPQNWPRVASLSSSLSVWAAAGSDI